MPKRPGSIPQNMPHKIRPVNPVPQMRPRAVQPPDERVSVRKDDVKLAHDLSERRVLAGERDDVRVAGRDRRRCLARGQPDDFVETGIIGGAMHRRAEDREAFQVHAVRNKGMGPEVNV